MSSSESSIEIQNLPRECHQALILAVLAGGPPEGYHGYRLALELRQKSGQAFSFNHGTLYPILHKLEQDGLIAGDWLEEPGKRKRKRYSLTEAGRSRLAQQAGAWLDFFDRFFAVLGEVGR